MSAAEIITRLKEPNHHRAAIDCQSFNEQGSSHQQGSFELE